MKKKSLYSILTTYMATLGVLSSCDKTQTSEEKTPQKIQIAYTYVPRELKMRVDTVDVTDENFEEIRKTAAGGLFIPSTNTVVLKYFQTTSENSCIVNYCNNNNNLHRLVLRHEMEHARKQDYVYGTTTVSRFGCAQTAALNEVVAPASEIIEAMDYYASTGERLPQKAFITRADSAINKIPGISTQGYINYNYQPIADVIVTYALEGFLDAVNRGFYKSTINKAYNKKRYKKNNPTIPYLFFLFNPDLGMWDPLWELESNAGTCNPYKNASQAVRQKLMHSIDSVVCSATGTDNFMIFYRNCTFR